jgi:hypothetical protein
MTEEPRVANPFFNSDPAAESGYRRIITRLGDALSRSGGGFKELPACSLYQDISDVRRRYENPGGIW